jgi:orotate phosphoribosyltransferase
MTFDLAGALLEAGAVRLSPKAPFTWASGLKSPIYCDNRQLLGHPKLRAAIALALVDRARTLAPTLIAGTATAGIPWAAFVAAELDLPMAYVRAEAKKHGMGRQVEGPEVKGQRVLLLEDLISTGGSSLRCAEALRAEGAELLEVLALFSYGLPQAEAAFREAGVALAVLATFEDLLAGAQARGILDAADRAALADWRLDTVAWSGRWP